MSNRAHIIAALLAALTLLPATPGSAAVILITHAKALAGNVTPGDTAGYPVSLTTPGSFQLDSNLFVAANKIGIQVTSKNVTIDLNGFTLEGSDVAWYGIVGSVNAVTIANGTVTRFKFDGIHGANTSKYWIADNLRSIENGRDGMVLGDFALVKSSVVVENALRGIVTGVSSVIQGNTVSDNESHGILASDSAIVGNVINLNGIAGIQTVGSTVVGNLMNGNGSFGLSGSTTTGYSGNTLALNNSNGVQAVDVVPAHPNACPIGSCP